MQRKQFMVYIMASENRTLYIGVTSNLEYRVLQHKTKAFAGFTAKYNINKLVYYEEHASALEAIAREKQLKKWRREKKLNLIERENLAFEDLAANWY